MCLVYLVRSSWWDLKQIENFQKSLKEEIIPSNEFEGFRSQKNQSFASFLKETQKKIDIPLGEGEGEKDEDGDEFFDSM